MFAVFVDVILPILLVAAIGGEIAHRAGMPITSLSTLAFEVFSPALVFESLRDVHTDAAVVGRVVFVVLASFVLTATSSMVWSRAVGHDRVTGSASALCAAVANTGNMGLPVASLAFGPAGLDIAVVAFVTSSVLAYSGGVFLASCATASTRTAARAPLRVPALWAAAAALVVRSAEVPIPSLVYATTSTLAAAAIPTMLVVLGLRVREHGLVFDGVRHVAVPVALRLCAGPAVALALAALVGLHGLAERTVVVVGGMPTAVNATILATQYRARPALVTQVVVLSTLVSVLTLTLLVAWLR
jgi:predicted permease